jgi:hypothetical protein
MYQDTRASRAWERYVSGHAGQPCWPVCHRIRVDTVRGTCGGALPDHDVACILAYKAPGSDWPFARVVVVVQGWPGPARAHASVQQDAHTPALGGGAYTREWHGLAERCAHKVHVGGSWDALQQQDL